MTAAPTPASAPDHTAAGSHAQDPAPPVKVRDLSVTLGTTHVLKGVDLDIPSGDLGVIVGPSGCGKSTLLRAIAGLRTPDSGTITVGAMTVDGPDVHVPTRRRRIGWVPQEATLLPQLTVGENIAFGHEGAFGRTKRKDRSARQESIDVLMEATGLEGLHDRYPDQLSGGQAQRVALARTLAARPRLLLLDEPFAALDPPLRLGLRDVVRDLLHEFGITGIMVTHDQEEALTTGDVVAIMRDGVMEQQGAPAAVYAHPASAWAASFLGEAVFLTGAAHDGSVTTPLGSIALEQPVTGDVRVVIRPEQVVVHPDGVMGGVLPATVTRVRFGGHDALVELVAGDGTTYLSRVHAREVPVVGDQVTLSVLGDAVVVD
ncbi:ABC transporter ATP-binding protein [Demequina sp. B12]|uniref:ABC transporter ATP-binding protein n=1 Tax=Demequina sp. B12 TaxID=2992757 RepID=UPI00237A78B4|nr:ABC transporter ATP-binding protein [Demequina sp. B12]MDE0571957.1 ABC transporter ATP-binding protein [Demequina sp. B12]